MAVDTALSLLYTKKVKDPLYSEGENIYIVRWFSEEQVVEFEFLKKVFEELFLRRNDDEKTIGPFAFEEELKRYADTLLEKLSLTQIQLLSPEDYNQGLRSINDVKGLKNLMRSVGQNLENKNKQGRSGFFKKLFGETF